MTDGITEIPATEFQNNAGQYFDEAGKRPVFITKYGRRSRVLLDVDEYERLKALDERHVSAETDALIAETSAEHRQTFEILANE